MSSVDQNLDRQLEAIGDVDRVLEEKVSGGSRTDRIALLDCISYGGDGDVVRVASMDRLARSLGDLRDIVDEITANGASVEFVKEQQTYRRDTDDAIGRLMLNLLGAFAEFERTLIRDNARASASPRPPASTRAAPGSSPTSRLLKHAASSAPASPKPRSLGNSASTAPPCTGCSPHPLPHCHICSCWRRCHRVAFSAPSPGIFAGQAYGNTPGQTAGGKAPR